MANLKTYFSYPSKKWQRIKPEDSFPDFGGNWIEQSDSKAEAQMPEKEMLEFIKNALWRIRRWTTYHEHYCSKYELDKLKRKRIQDEETEGDSAGTAKGLSREPKEMFDEKEEFLRAARKLYSKDPNRTVLKPLDTTRRFVGYAPLKLYQTNLSEYQDTINRIGYECLGKPTEKITLHNGGLPRWKIPPEEPRQPMLNAVPNGERLY